MNRIKNRTERSAAIKMLVIFACFIGLAGLIIGLVEAFGGLFFDSYTGQMLCFVIFALVLFLKPNGLFGKKV